MPEAAQSMGTPKLIVSQFMGGAWQEQLSTHTLSSLQSFHDSTQFMSVNRLLHAVGCVW